MLSQDYRKEKILEKIYEAISKNSAVTTPMKKVFSKSKIDEIIEEIYQILWDEKFNDNQKEITKKIKKYIELEITANSKWNIRSLR